MQSVAQMNNVDVTIGKRIADLRMAMNLTRSDVASAANVSVDVLDLYEAGRLQIPTESLLEISRLFGVELSYFFVDITHVDDGDPLFCIHKPEGC